MLAAAAAATAALWFGLQRGPALVAAWDAQPDGYEVIDGPADTSQSTAWLENWTAWRQVELPAHRYNAEDACNVYNMPALEWTQRNFVQAMLLLHDRAIFDREANQFSVDSYVKGIEARVGKLDSVLLWPAYPNIGIDNRNQMDFLRHLPGGLDGVRQLIAAFHRHDIRVIIPYNPWDTATRDETGREDDVRMYSADIATLQQIVPSIGADGFNGDTMFGVPKSFFNCSSPLVATPEGGVPTAYLSHNPISWGYFFGFGNFPPVARAKFLEPRHMVQICARWSLDRLADLHTAFFNGAGYVVWENVWGIWNAMTDRESEAAKRMFAILRRFSFATSSSRWRPYYDQLTPSSRVDGVFASEFPVVEDGDERCWLYTVINTAEVDKTVRLSLAKHHQHADRVRVYNLYHGVELDQADSVSFALEPQGFGAVFVSSAVSSGPCAVDNLAQFLDDMAAMTATPLASFSSQRKLLQQHLIKSDDSTAAFVDRSKDDRKEMVLIRGSSNWWFNVSGVQIEPVHAWTPSWPQLGLGVQFPWEDRPWNNHSVQLLIQDFHMDRFPVTNLEFARFLQESKYEPHSLVRFLDHWDNRVNNAGALNSISEWKIPPRLENSPVVHVAREDAVAFAAFYGKRLPHDWEWQYVAANGEHHTSYPWGSDFDESILHKVSRGKNPPLSDSVGSHPRSKSSAFGVEDLVGYVWQMTDTLCDDHTCGLLLRGGSYYRPVASTLSDPNWYFPQAYAAQQHNRFLLQSQSYDRSAFIGFRCVRSVVDNIPIDGV